MEENGGPFDHGWGPVVEVVNGSTTGKGSDEFKKSSAELRGSIAERRAAKFGFNAASIMNVAQLKISSPPSSSPTGASSPYLTIPPGISPAALLDFPLILHNSLPSPTTGTFSFPSCNYESLTLNLVSPTADRGKDDTAADSFSQFKPPPPPPGDPTQMLCVSSVDNQPPTTSEYPAESSKPACIKNCDMDTFTETNVPENLTQNAIKADLQLYHTGIADNKMPRLKESIKEETGAHDLMEVDHKGTYPSAPAAVMTRSAEDGYCWRKYGQKHVKGSEYPRSYYRCNNSNCLVKKKVERSHDGEITEIIYKGAHNHPKPHPRLCLGNQASSSEFLEMETSEGSGTCPRIEGGTGSKYNQLKTKDFRAGSDWRAPGFERTSSSSALNEISDPLSTCQGKCVTLFGSVETPEITTTIASQDCDNEDGGTQGSTSRGYDADGDETEPKRRKKETFSTEAYLPSRSTREPRIILQIESEIDVLDDGYRWRKYGQKVVKGNPNPRSYYKCTTAGCPVRKHVERACEDIKSVITTYEGKHNHEVPTIKTTGTANVGNSPPNVSDPNHVLTLPKNSNVSNPGMQVQDLPLHFQMKSTLGNEFARSNLLGDLVSDMKIGASSIYQMKFPPLHSPMPYSPFLMNSNGNESCIGAPFGPEFPMPIPMSVPRSTTMAVNSFFSNNHARPSGAVQSSLGSQQIKESDLKFFKPKEEQKDDQIYDSCLATPDKGNASSSTVLCRSIGNFPS